MTGSDRVAGIVLAGGRSSRFGADKLHIDLGGRRLIDHAIEAVAAVADEILVVVAPGADPGLSSSAAQPPGDVRLVHDPRPFAGPLVGLAAALAEARSTVALVVAGDMPSLVPGVLALLVGSVRAGAPAAVLEVPGRVQPLPIALLTEPGRAAAATILASQHRALRDFAAALGTVTVPEATWRVLDPDARTIRDIDRPGDLPA